MKDFDLLIKNAIVIDGNKTPRRISDIGIIGDKIVAIGVLDNKNSNRVIDASGLVVAPGFIDVHNHSEGWILKEKALNVKLSQGFTTEILMSDGISYAPVNDLTSEDWMFYLRCLNGLEPSDYKGWKSISDYLNQIDKQTAQNVATQIPYANIRAIEHGWSSKEPTKEALLKIQQHISLEMESGAVGLSTGLEYVNECFATTKELISACSAISPYHGLHITHIRYPLGILEGLKEAVEISKLSKTALHVSHLKGSTKELSEKIINYIDQYAINEVDFSFDVYPYASASTMLHYLLPYEVWEDGPLAARLKIKTPKIVADFERLLANEDLSKIQIAWLPEGPLKCYQGKYLDEYISDTKQSAGHALIELLLQAELAVLLVFHREDLGITDQFLSHEKFMLGTDGIYFPGAPVHPRVSGSVGKILGSCVRVRKLFSLEDAIYKLSSFAADKFGLKNRGYLKEGYFADLAIFDPTLVNEKHNMTFGFNYVIVNGEVVFEDGNVVLFDDQAWPGRVIKKS